MKLRILGNTLRLRLSQTEVKDLLKDMHVSDSVDFGERKLIYALQGSGVEKISARFNGDFVTVDVPAEQLRIWGETSEVSLNATQDLPDGNHLEILVEKDFACLVPRKGEEDLYPNPRKNKD